MPITPAANRGFNAIAPLDPDTVAMAPASLVTTTGAPFPQAPTPSYASEARPRRQLAESPTQDTADGPDDSHVDNSWDAFKRGFTDSLRNPVGWSVGQIVEAAGGTKEQIELGKRFGDSPFGEGLAQLAKLMGATEEQAAQIHNMGKSVEGFVPGYGQARFASSIIADVANPPDFGVNQERLEEIHGQFKSLPGYRPQKNQAGASAVFAPKIKQIEPRPSAEKASPSTARGHGYAAPMELNRSPAMTTGVEKGTHVIDGKTYIQLEGETVQVRYDQQLKSWKVINPENPYAFHDNKPVRLNEHGQWQRMERPGLRGGGWFDRAKPKPEPSTSTRGGGLSEPEQYVQQLLERRQASPGHRGIVHSVDRLKALDFPVPSKVHRAHPGQTAEAVTRNGLQRAAGGTATGDDYLAAIVKHTARTGGSAGEVMSLTADKSVANRFSRKGTVDVFTIDTTMAPAAFRTVPDIILKDGPRLVKDGKITQATLLQAIDKVGIENEKEVFYVGGDIPTHMMVTPSAPNG